jgi:hypothetical protein
LVQGLLFYWIDTESRGAAISREHDPVILAAAHEAQAALAFVHPAAARADVALHPAVLQRVPIPGVDDRVSGLAFGLIQE